ncbi:MAG TPA: beta-ketoacyl synthase N-terminal-like domain-containing protein [Chthoniobacterales bacterium]
MSSPRTVITGLGAVCGAGMTVDAIWNAVQSGESAIGPIKGWDTSRWPVRNAAEVVADNVSLVPDRKLHKMISRTDLFGLYAVHSAIQQSGLLGYREKLDEQGAAQFSDRTGVFSGPGGGAYQSNYDFLPLLTVAGGDLQTFGSELGNTVNPMWLLKNLPNNVLCHVGIRYGFKGTNACIANQCVGGVLAVAEAAAAIRDGEADRAVAVGHDAPLEPENALNYHRLGLLADDNLRPFDRQRAGTIFGEGAGALVLEKEAGAQCRQAVILGEFLGSGCTTEAIGFLDVRPDGDGVSRAIELALTDAGIARNDVGMIVAHGNGTRSSDASEVIAIRRVFGEDPPPVTAFKWAFGHSIAASGVIDLVLALIALRQQIVPGIPTLESLDPALAPFPVASTAQKPRSDIAVVISRGFGGMNVAIIVRAVAG